MAEPVAVMTRRGAAFSMAEPVAVMMRRGEEEDEEGAAAATSPIFCVARNRERPHRFLHSRSFSRGRFASSRKKASSRQSEEPGKRHRNKVRFRDYYCCCRPVSIYFHLLLLLLPPVL
ncbi:hypothetical protein CY35_06G055100 [Sphagnum magellanicum]|nr:hypothetical protein CY35_06G055100 [Sphagnum magellanicum]